MPYLLTCWSSRAVAISTCHVNRGYHMLLLFLFVLLFVCLFVFLFLIFFPREICTYSNFLSYYLSLFFFVFFLYFVSYILFLAFTLCDFCIPIKHGFLNVSLFWADMNCFYLHTFYSILTFLYFHMITNFDSHSHHYDHDYFCCYCFCHCHCHYYFFIFIAFNFYFSSFYYSILSLYISNTFKF